MKIVHESYEKFRNNAQNKKIIFYGAGTTVDYYLKTICSGLNVISMIDRDKRKWGSIVCNNGKKYPVMSLRETLDKINYNEIENYILFITPTLEYSRLNREIVDELNTVPELDEMLCYVGAVVRDWYEPKAFEFTKGKQVIPHKIHYIWMGGTQMPELSKRCMESWYRYCPDFEIIRWDENNYDFTKCRYMKEAYEAKQWELASDYARLDIIFNEGGIYFDTDVELIKPIEELLCDDAFFGFAANYYINTGIGFGATKGNSLIAQLRDKYHDQRIILEDGKLNLKACHEYQNPIFVEKGFSLVNSYQKKEGVVIYPSEVFSPFGIVDYAEHFTSNTYAIHYGNLDVRIKNRLRMTDN